MASKSGLTIRAHARQSDIEIYGAPMFTDGDELEGHISLFLRERLKSVGSGGETTCNGKLNPGGYGALNPGIFA
jgi:hypothetical protein